MKKSYPYIEIIATIILIMIAISAFLILQSSTSELFTSKSSDSDTIDNDQEQSLVSEMDNPITGNIITDEVSNKEPTERSNDNLPSNADFNNEDKTPPFQIITSSQLSLHNKETDCWIAFRGRVYDITRYLKINRGRVGPITSYCGTSEDFEKNFLSNYDSPEISRLMQQGIYKGNLG